MTITTKVVAHSRAPGAPDLITLQLRYPRMIHAEFLTHRVFSRNASSSRAIPIERMIQDVIEDPATPVVWGSNKPGMQAGDEIDTMVDFGTHSAIESAYGRDEVSPKEAWLICRDLAIEGARAFASAGYHKQIANRLLEPFGHISVVVTATEWDNFFDLRCHPDADPTMRALAEAMRDAIAGSEPDPLIILGTESHLPYVTDGDVDLAARIPADELFSHFAMISAARCARVSYLNHDGSNPDIEKDLALAKRLLESKHMSPFEHQAKLLDTNQGATGIWPPEPAIQLSNLRYPWQQHRKMLEA